MKKILFICFLSGFFSAASFAQYGVDRTGYEGDYFSLEGAIELFKESRSISNFERKLNNEDSWVNNLDLNYDGNIDYIRVEHRNQGDFHAIILQAILGRREVQDVAVIEIERTGRRTAILQIIGDPDLYGEEVIAEPYNSAGYSSSGQYNFERGYVNVFYWRAVQSILDRSYVTYVSPFRWNYYPSYWRPWRQHGWSIYHPRRVRYYNHCHIVYVHRVVRVHHFYRPFRSHSIHVTQRTNKYRKKYGSSVVHRSHGKKNHTYRTSVRSKTSNNVGPRNNAGSRKVASQSRSKTTSPRSSNHRNSNTQINRKSVSKNYSTPERKRTVSSGRSSNQQKSQMSRSSQQRSSQTTPKQNRVNESSRQSRTQSKSAPRTTQKRTTQSRKQSSPNRTNTRSTTRKSTSVKKSVTPRKSSATRSSSNSKSSRKGRG